MRWTTWRRCPSSCRRTCSGRQQMRSARSQRLQPVRMTQPPSRLALQQVDPFPQS